MDDKEKIAYLDRLNENQRVTIVALQTDNFKLEMEVKRYHKFLQKLSEECESSLLPWQYRWVVQRINKFLVEKV